MTDASSASQRAPYPHRFVPPAGKLAPWVPQHRLYTLGSRLFDVGEGNNVRIHRRMYGLLWLLHSFAHLVGAFACLVIVTNVTPGASIFSPRFVVLTAYAVPAYIACAYLLGMTASMLLVRKVLRWFVNGDTPTEEDREAVLLAPRRLTLLQLAFWLLGAIIFGVLYGRVAPYIAIRIVVTVVCGAVIMSAICFLAAEFVFRPAAAVVLQYYTPHSRVVSGIGSRFFLTWWEGTAIPAVGLLIVAGINASNHEFETEEISRYAITMAIVILMYSGVLTIQMINYVTPPLTLMRQGLEAVSAGNLDAELVVFDGSEVGELQSGFNSMVRELREQERIKSLFEQHVGTKIAERALSSTADTHHATQREATVFFIDIIGSTKLSLEHDGDYVVDLLGRFYTIVVEEVNNTGGMVNKFAGDAVLAIYNVPDDHPDPAGAALYCSRRIMHRLERELPEITAAVGISSGTVVAGNIGSEERYEYTVIGDPVNVAARLSEHAKQEPGRILASQRVVNLANDDEARRWMIDGAIVLRGRKDATVLARPEKRVVQSFAEREHSTSSQ